MKLLIGIIIGAVLATGTVALAETKHGMVIVNEITINSFFRLEKVYDYDNGAVCYTLSGGSSGTAISCLKNP